MKGFSLQVGPAGSDEMPRGYRCTETELDIFDCALFNGSVAWKATLEWLRFHNIDPMAMPAEQTVVRDLANRRVVYEEFVLDEHGKPAIERDQDGEPCVVPVPAHSQGETEPMPFPRELWRDLSEHVSDIRLTEEPDGQR